MSGMMLWFVAGAIGCIYPAVFGAIKCHYAEEEGGMDTWGIPPFLVAVVTVIIGFLLGWISVVASIALGIFAFWHKMRGY